MMKATAAIIALCCSLIFIGVFAGCAHGPVRHHTLGYYKYAAVELTKRSHLLVKPAALPVGLAADIVLIAVDTAATPVAAFFVPSHVIDVSADEETNGLANLVIPTYPLTLVNIGALNMGSGTKEEYEAIFGHESSLFQDPAADVADQPGGSP